MHPPMRGGGSPVGAPSGMAVKTRWRPLGPWAPSRKNLGFAGGDSAVWYGMVWYGMVWYGMVWYDMVWYGMVWYDMVSLPGQGAREQSAGVTVAGRVPTTTEGGGGGSAFCLGGGGGACRCERDHLPMRPWFPPPPWGEGVRTCAKRRRDGGRDGGTTCPGTCGAPVPLASSRHSPATGEGATSCAEVD